SRDWSSDVCSSDLFLDVNSKFEPRISKVNQGFPGKFPTYLMVTSGKFSTNLILVSGKLSTIFHSPHLSGKLFTNLTFKSGKLSTTLTFRSGKLSTTFIFPYNLNPLQVQSSSIGLELNSAKAERAVKRLKGFIFVSVL